MPKYIVKPGRSFHYIRVWSAGETVDYPGPPGEALILVDGETPWTSPHQQGCEPGGQAAVESVQPDLAGRLDRARTSSPGVDFGAEPTTLSELQAQDRARADAEREKWGGADPAAFDHDGDGKPGGSRRGRPKSA